MIPEREREALMRLTMCARRECFMCRYQIAKDKCDDVATNAMHILADALRKMGEAEQTEPNVSDIPTTTEDCSMVDDEDLGVPYVEVNGKDADCPWK